MALLVTVSGCYNSNEVTKFLQKPHAPVSALEYRILPPDLITITSIQVPEINGFQSQVRPDGKINVPLLGEIYVADKTPKEVEEAVKEAAKKYYDEVDASVQIAGYNSRKFYVFGEVSRPGAIRWTGCDTLLDVLASAQPNPLAWPERIIVIRSTQPSQGGYESPPSTKYAMLGINHGPKGPLADGQTPNAAADANAPGGTGSQPARAEKMTINLMAMVQHGDMSNNILLQPNDIVYVQPNPFGYVAREFEKIWSPFRVVGDGLGDFRRYTGDVRWIGDGMPKEAGGSSATIIAR
jgi:protein involved in polysaccharide export with SLBB domain